jgi:surface antigen
MKTRIALIVLPLLLAGCQTTGFGRGVSPKVETGLGPGAANPGITGGGLIGGKLGVALDKADRAAGFEAEYKALEYSSGGELVTWTGKSGGASGRVVAAQPYRVGSQDCRQYSHELLLAGAAKSGRGTACRNSDGTWTLLE